MAASPSAKRDAEILLEKVTSVARTRLLSFGETVLSTVQCTQLEVLLQRREQGEPVAYLTGECEFWSLRLRVSADTLIPRPDTECVVRQALDLLPAVQSDVLDLGTGTGSIALALASERPAWRITGVDRQPGAVVLASDNAAQLGIKNVQFLDGDWFEPLQAKRYNLIVSNPPYIEANDPHLLQGDVRFEPRSALVSGEDGLMDLMTICRQADVHLLPGGWLILEHGWQQGDTVRALLANAGFSHIATLRDYGYNERVSQGQWCPDQK
ncbi:MAG: protein-(glutamine-N(5)) methyltransferase [Sodalis sp. Psp]|nr:protein-(glutamine-N(5)) methyltransferase [Sodalis sp. Psp]MCR3757031.1 protein-(glutamine-N(5)) methyltransferase [Sodalis sp. Ppy]